MDKPPARGEGRSAQEPPAAGTAVRTGVAQRVLALLAAFDTDHRELTLTALARRAGLPAATAHRLVGELTAWGALEHAKSGAYRIGPRLPEVASLAPRNANLRRVAVPFMEDLYETTHESVQLAVRDGLDVLYVELISAHSSVAVPTTVGSRWPLHATGAGLVLLAHAEPDLQEQISVAPLERFTSHTLTDAVGLRETLEEVRRSGAAVSDRQIAEDATSIAAPIRNASGNVIAALSMVVPATANAAVLVAAVRMAARGTSRALGHPAGPPSP
jgi:DNA-binding IclR family transcriptional regulator